MRAVLVGSSGWKEHIALAIKQYSRKMLKFVIPVAVLVIQGMLCA